MKEDRKYMTDAKGRLVPIEQVKEIDLLRDELVRELCDSAKEQSGRLRRVKDQMMHEVQAFISLSAEKYDIKYGGKKGNVQLVSFDGQYKVLIAIKDKISFDERLQVAKELIDNCIRRWSEGSRSEIIALVQDAFNVDKTGRLNTDRILGLRRLEISDPEWKKAMDAISDSVQVSESKPYIRFYERDPEGAYQQISLDLSTL